MNRPLVTVLMGCYNSSRYIREAIDSILNQTLSDFEFIIVDDCSTDNTVDIVNSYHDSRIKLFVNPENKGLGYSLYFGVNESKGKYIARMDADDIALPKRLEIEVAYLQKHPDVLVIGAGAMKYGDVSFWERLLHPNIIHAGGDYIKAYSLTGVPFQHPTVMFNADIMKSNGINYDLEFQKAQDYELWSRVIWDFKTDNIEDVVLKYRFSSAQASVVASDEQKKRSAVMFKRILEKVLGRPITDYDMERHYLYSHCSYPTSEEQNKILEWINILYESNFNTKMVDDKIFNKVLSHRWYQISKNVSKGFSRLQTYRRCHTAVGLDLLDKMKLIVR